MVHTKNAHIVFYLYCLYVTTYNNTVIVVDPFYLAAWVQICIYMLTQCMILQQSRVHIVALS